MFLGDSPSLTTGLARIGRDLAIRLSSLPQFRVGYLGRGGAYSRYLPFAQYNFDVREQYGEAVLEGAWNDFAGSERGILFTIWDATRLSWLAMPELLMPCPLKAFVSSRPFSLWGYFPVDAISPSGGVGALSKAIVGRYDRVLAYSKFGAAALGSDWCPHGIDTTIFAPRNKRAGREFLQGVSGGRFRICDSDPLIGVVAINQSRKDWGLIAATLRKLKQQYGSLKSWWHTDVLERDHCWNLAALISDFGLTDNVLLVTGADWRDSQVALAYSACDLTLAPGMEGFGFPIAESIACGTPVITGAGHGGSELISGAGGELIQPIAHRLEGIHDSIRAVHDSQHWATTAASLIADKRDINAVRETVEFLDYKTLWPGYFQKWFLGGL